MDADKSGNGATTRRLAHILLLGVIYLAAAGCNRAQIALDVWRQSERFEHAAEYNTPQAASEQQWLLRVVAPSNLPNSCVHPLTDCFDFVLMRRQEQWQAFVNASNLRADTPAPDFSKGVVAGLIAHVGQPPPGRWPIVITKIRQRGPVGFIQAEFHEGYYRPLDVPPFAHLVFVHGVADFLGMKLERMLFGFNIEIADLNAVGLY